ncbi:PTS sugar transporter subunit IIA [uncultured Cedecea sp.]|uniref:PTS sugar transporter subunit IIA n=1 Tax=uncultured Cedecea sp. TaxID=988762 RepID=UPI00262ACD76|nr:PTS sugar transporter subunit IIA [uncultured Cedecea sp.]
MINDVKWIQARRHAKNWQQAIDIAAHPLILFGAAQPQYLDGIIENTLSWGPYYLIAPGVALPHARPEQGANHNQITVTTLSTPVEFGHEDCDPVWLLLCVSAIDANEHIKIIQKISQLIDSPEILITLREAQTDEDLYSLIANSLTAN